MKSQHLNRMTFAATVAALYLILTYLSSLLGLANQVVQLRLSEVLCVLPAFFPATIAGLGIGCMLSNFLCGGMLWDVLFGTLATLAGAVGTYLLRRHNILRLLPPVVINAVTVGLMLRYVYGFADALPLWFLILSVGIGELVTAGIGGYFFGRALQKRLPHPITERGIR